MSTLISASFADSSDVRTPDKTRVESVDLGGVRAARFTFEPGWKWSECVQPVAGTDSCQAHHVGAVVSGRLAVQHEDGSTMSLSPGDAYVIEPGHDAWVEGDEAFVGYEFDKLAAEHYAEG